VSAPAVRTPKPVSRRLTWAGFILFLSVIGPGIITANVDNDAGGIATYSLVGARAGYGLLWVLIPVTLALIVVQEMCARMGAVTGKGLADLIRENFGVKLTFYLMVALLVANVGNAMAEFSGVAAAGEIFGIPRLISVPIAAAFVAWLVIAGSYRRVERVFLGACVFYISYIIAGVLAKPEWGEVGHATFVPHMDFQATTLVMIIGIVGTTIAPWMQFYLQSAIVDKGVGAEEYHASRIDVIGGCVVAVIVAFFIVVTCAATLHVKGIQVTTVSEAAQALAPITSKYCTYLFAFGLLNASVFAACILPLTTAYSICEGLGWERGVNNKFSEAPQFYTLYVGVIALSAAIILLPHAPLLGIMYFSQVANGILLPFVLIFMLVLINRSELMGRYRNSKTFNAIAWTTTVVVILLTLALLVASFVPGMATV
jgi:NRAMP (natural resistance-associated macrophage protein)-like metal ion transporter